MSAIGQEGRLLVPQRSEGEGEKIVEKDVAGVSGFAEA
jgi:hypothetical protein